VKAFRIGALLLSVTLATSIHAQTSEKIVVDGSTGVMPLMAALAKAYQERPPAATVEMGKGLGTNERLQALADGRIDIALASHGMVVEELTRRGMAVHEIAKVAVVFGVNASVPMTNITDGQICDIYAGTIQNWKELGGVDLAIAPRTRPDSEVDAEVVRGKICMFKEPQNV
jgi:phosphate transport system substrate-binding protein